jgi:hypothetical protein
VGLVGLHGAHLEVVVVEAGDGHPINAQATSAATTTSAPTTIT